MAKRSRHKEAAAEATSDAAPTAGPREAAIQALMALAAERRFAEIGLNDIAGRAGLTLAELRAAFPGKFAILAAFADHIDQAVLSAGTAEGETERDRLFDVLMRRFDAMAPYRAALRNLARSGRRDPALALAAVLLSRRSMKWMLAAAGAPHEGLLGRFARGGASAVFAEAMMTWLDDDDSNHEKTMAALDSALRRGERAFGYVRDACDFLATFGRRERRETGTPETTA